MTDEHKPRVRQRPIDDAKPLQLVKDMNEILKSGDSAGKKEFNIIEREIKNILELYDKKKTIVIPKAEVIEKPSTGSAPSGATSNASKENYAYAINYEQTEYERPKQYILYSEKRRKETVFKDYEGSRVDLKFLAFENNFMTLNELEEVIIALENDIGSGEQIPNERIKEIIMNISLDKAVHVNKLTKYFNTRREEYKKSLLRKYWKEQKTTDKFLNSTYRRRDREKMKTRRNKQNEGESLLKLREIKDTFNHSLQLCLNPMKLREEWKYNLIKTNHHCFQEEVALIKGDKASLTANEADWATFNKIMGKIILNEKTINGTSAGSTGVIGSKQSANDIHNNLANTSPLSTTGLTNDKHENAKGNHALNRMRPKKTSKNLKSANPLSLNNTTTTNASIQPHPKAPMSSHSHTSHHHNPSSHGHAHPHHTHTKKEESNKEKRSHFHKKIEEEKEPDHCLKLRIRLNRANQLVIDRYIQSKQSFNPFDDSITIAINKYKTMNEDLTYHNDKEANFDNLYNEYLKTEIDGFGLISDSEDDNANFQNQIKNFQYAHKQFLKMKRGHPGSSI